MFKRINRMTQPLALAVLPCLAGAQAVQSDESRW